MDFDPLPPDPYAALGVSKNDDLSAIKSSYRKLALKYHPDKCEESLREKNVVEFHKIQEAYNILSDDEKRKHYDSLKRLHELRRQNAELRSGGSGFPRPPMRSQTFYSEPYVFRGARFEERKPKFYDDMDDEIRGTSRKTADFDSRRSTGAPRAERVRVERVDKEAEERRRKERLREADIRGSRSTKYEYEDRYSSPRDYGERDKPRRKADDRSDKYDEWTKEAERHLSSEPRPAPIRRDGSAQVPQHAYVRRSQAPPKDQDDRMKEKQREANRERERAREKEDVRPSRRSERSRRGENVEPWQSRPSTLKTSYSSPIRDDDYTFLRTQTEPVDRSEPSQPTLQRAETMPSVPTTANTSARRRDPPRSSRFRETTIADSGYSSSSSADQYSKPAAQPVKTDRVYYETREPLRRSRSRSHSRSRDRGPKLSSSRRPSYPPTGKPIWASVGSMPSRPRSPDRRRERERSSTDRYTTSDRLYGERSYPPPYGREYSREDVNYQKPFTAADIRYCQVRRSSADPGYGGYPSISRNMPLSSYA